MLVNQTDARKKKWSEYSGELKPFEFDHNGGFFFIPECDSIQYRFQKVKPSTWRIVEEKPLPQIKVPFHPSLIFNNVHLKELETHKHPGVILSSNLSWNLHLDETVKEAYSRLGTCMLWRFKYILDRKYLQTVNFSFVRLS